MDTFLKRMRAPEHPALPNDLAAYYARVPSLSPVFADVPFQRISQQSIEPLAYYVSAPSKCLRTLLCLVVGDVLGVSDDPTLLLVGQTLEIIHNSSLLIDDIEDKSQTRRGLPSAHVRFGLQSTINSGCFGYFFATDFLLGNVKRPLSDTQKWRVSAAITRMFLEGHVGNAFDLASHTGISVQSQFSTKDYAYSTMLKTTPLFKLGLWLIEALFEVDPGAARHVEKSLELLGLGFQILNDLEAQDPGNKQFGNDLLEKKMSYPMLLFWEATPNPSRRQRFVDLFNGPFSAAANLEFRALIDGSVQRAAAEVEDIQAQLEAQVSRDFGGAPAARAFGELYNYFKQKMKSAK